MRNRQSMMKSCRQQRHQQQMRTSLPVKRSQWVDWTGMQDPQQLHLSGFRKLQQRHSHQAFLSCSVRQSLQTWSLHIPRQQLL